MQTTWRFEKEANATAHQTAGTLPSEAEHSPARLAAYGMAIDQRITTSERQYTWK
jgi:hypothetical protein